MLPLGLLSLSLETKGEFYKSSHAHLPSIVPVMWAAHSWKLPITLFSLRSILWSPAYDANIWPPLYITASFDCGYPFEWESTPPSGISLYNKLQGALACVCHQFVLVLCICTCKAGHCSFSPRKTKDTSTHTTLLAYVVQTSKRSIEIDPKVRILETALPQFMHQHTQLRQPVMYWVLSSLENVVLVSLNVKA